MQLRLEAVTPRAGYISGQELRGGIHLAAATAIINTANTTPARTAHHLSLLQPECTTRASPTTHPPQLLVTPLR